MAQLSLIDILLTEGYSLFHPAYKRNFPQIPKLVMMHACTKKNPFKDRQEDQSIKADSAYQAHSKCIKMRVSEPFFTVS